MLLHHDNFNHYTYAQAAASGEVTSIVALNSSLDFPAGQGRDGLAALASYQGVACYDTYWRKTLAPTNPNCYMGVRCRIGNLPGSGGGGMMTCLSGNTGQMAVIVNPDGTLAACKGAQNDYIFTAGAVLGSTTFSLSTGVRYFVELWVFPHTTLGSVKIRVNGIERLSLQGTSGTPLNTNGAGSGTWNGALLGNFGQGGNPFVRSDMAIYFNDWYVCDGTVQPGPNPLNNFLGDCKTTVVLPTLPGFYQQAVPNAGTNHVTPVDDPTPNDDTDYTELINVGERENWKYVLPVPLGGGGVLAATLALWMKKASDGTRFMRDSVRVASVDYDGTTDIAFGTTYLFSRSTRTANPATGGEFTPGSTVEFGTKVQV